MTNPRALIWAQAIPHVCQPGVTCSGGHGDDCMEIPSITFIDATQATEKRPNGEPLAPD